MGTSYAEAFPLLDLNNSPAPMDSPRPCPVCGKALPKVAPEEACPHCFSAQHTTAATDLPIAPLPPAQVDSAHVTTAAQPQQNVTVAAEPSLPAALDWWKRVEDSVVRNRQR